MTALRRLLTVTATIALVVCPSLREARGSARAAGCGGVQSAAPQHHNGSLPPLAVGDSTMLLALPGLAREGFEVNAHGCRQYPEALALLSALARANRLPHLVVIALGANGSIEPVDISRALGILGTGRVLALLTPRELGGGSGSDAQLVRAEGRRHGANLVVLDWVAYSAGHARWFEPDGLHVNPAGAAAMSRLISSVLPLAATPRSASVPHCQSPTASPPTATSPEAPSAPGEMLHAITVRAHGPVLLIDPRVRRLQIQVINPNVQELSGLVRVRADGGPLLAAACVHIPQAASIELKVPVSRTLLADAELFSRFKVRLALRLSSTDGVGVNTDSSYILRAGGR